MHLGLWTPLPHTIHAEPGLDDPVRFATTAVQAAEAYGFGVTLVAERWLGPDQSAWLLATALACATRRIEIMVAVHPGLLTPQAVAKMGASLDHISGGRFSMNVVNGWWEQEMNLFGNGAWLPASDARYRRMDEFIQAVRALWTGDAPRLEGEFFRLDGTRLPLRPVQAPCPPIYAASRSDHGKDIIARHCDWWFAEYDPDFRRYADNRDKIAADIADMRARAARHGRTLRFGLSAHVICADSVAASMKAADALEAYGKKDRLALSAVKALGAGLIGTPDQVAARIDDYAAIGVDCVMLRFHPMMAELDRFARLVMPRLACLSQPPSHGSGRAASAAAR